MVLATSLHTYNLQFKLLNLCTNTLNSLFSEFSAYFALFVPQILFKLLLSNALGRSAYSQEHFTTILQIEQSFSENPFQICRLPSEVVLFFSLLLNGGNILAINLLNSFVSSPSSAEISNCKW